MKAKIAADHQNSANFSTMAAASQISGMGDNDAGSNDSEDGLLKEWTSLASQIAGALDPKVCS